MYTGHLYLLRKFLQVLDLEFAKSTSQKIGFLGILKNYNI
jgi:hypothetical protein